MRLATLDLGGGEWLAVETHERGVTLVVEYEDQYGRRQLDARTVVLSREQAAELSAALRGEP